MSSIVGVQGAVLSTRCAWRRSHSPPWYKKWRPTPLIPFAKQQQQQQGLQAEKVKANSDLFTRGKRILNT